MNRAARNAKAAGGGTAAVAKAIVDAQEGVARHDAKVKAKVGNVNQCRCNFVGGGGAGNCLLYRLRVSPAVSPAVSLIGAGGGVCVLGTCCLARHKLWRMHIRGKPKQKPMWSQ
jgi:hypothetical protein